MFNFVSLEPVVFLVQFGMFIIMGGQVQTDLLLWKICHLELGYAEDICSNLTLDKYDAINDEVQEKVNNFQMIGGWLSSGPALIFSFFVGSLIDIYGCRRFILLPMIGLLLSDIGTLINCIFIDKLPLEFFYMEQLWAFFGGMPVYYLGKIFKFAVKLK